jgi:hypothetical protein
MSDEHATATGLVDQLTQLLVKNLRGRGWRPAKELQALITDEMAQARCETVHPLAIADLPDPTEYARLLLTKDALQALEASDTCELRGAEGKQEVRLVVPDGVAEVAAPPAATAASWDKSDVSVVQTTTQTGAQTGGKDVSELTTNSDNVTPAGTTDVNNPAAVQSDTSACDTDARPANEMASDSVPELPLHPVADLFPAMTDAEYEELKADIQENGLHVPISTYQGQIIDGRHRDRACREVGVPPRYQEWDGRGSLVAFVISLNDRRRHLSTSQRAMVAAKAKPMFEDEARQRQLTGKPADRPPNLEEGRQGEAAAQAAALMNVSISAVYQGQKVMRDGSPELQRAVSAGAVKVSTAADLAGLQHEEQDAALAQNAAKVRAKAKEGAQRKKAAARKSADGGTAQPKNTKGNGVKDIKADADVVKKQEEDEAAGFNRFLPAVDELDAVRKLDNGGFAALADQLNGKDREKLATQLHELCPWMNNLRKTLAAAKPTQARKANAARLRQGDRRQTSRPVR